MALENYHKVWLANHPDYDEAWLQTALKAGFDIHHLDGNHNNDAFENLLLIESCDHLRLHGQIQRLFGNRGAWSTDKSYRAKLGEDSYKMRCAGWSWPNIAKELGYGDKQSPTAYALNVAKAHADYYKKQWPVPHIPGCECYRCR